jgi:hypothetical protein
MLDTTLRLHTMYLNIEGLTPLKYQQLLYLLDERQFDLIVLSESWLPKFLHTPHPHVITSSVAYIDIQGHHPGGLTALCRPEDRAAFSCTSLPEAIHIIWKGVPLLFAYVPYAISTDDLQIMIDSWPPSQAIAADFNVDFNAQTIRPSLRTRANAIMKFTESNAMYLLPPSNTEARWDHLFAAPNTVSTYSTLARFDLPVKTNHPALCFTVVDPNECVDHSTSLPFDRHYVLSPLRNPITAASCKELFCTHYQFVQADVSRVLLSLWNKADECSNDDERQLLADEADFTLLGAIQTVCDELLFLHDGTARSPRPPQFDSTASIVQSYKHINALNKTNTSRRVVSDNPLLSPLAACARTWEEVWNRRPTQPRRPQFIRQDVTRYSGSDIRKLISSYPSFRASGMDGIHNLALLALQKSSFPHHLASTYSLYKRLQITPLRWNTGLTIMTPKDRSGLPSKCRPLTMISIFRMHFERLLKKEYSPQIERSLHPAQAGFRPGDHTLRQIIVAEQIVDRRFRTLVDFQQAFDSPLYTIIMESTMGLGILFSRLMFSLYCFRCTSILSVNGRRSSPIPRTQGLFQGPPLPPDIFSMILDGLIRSFFDHFDTGQAELLTVILAFADDIMVLSRFLYEAYQMVKFISEWSTPRGININYNKCAILSPGGESMDISTGGESTTVAWKSNEKYLGVHIDNRICFDEFYNDIIAKFTKNFNWMRCVARTWAPSARLVIYRTFLQPILDYASPLFALYTLNFNTPQATVKDQLPLWKRIAEVHNRAIAWIMHQKTYTRILHSILGWEPIVERFHTSLMTLKMNSYKNPHLLSRLPEITLVTRFRTQTARNMRRGEPTLGWKRWLLRRRIERHDKAPHRGRLIQSRNNNGYDHILDNRIEKTLQIHLIWWRKGMFGWKVGLSCAHCSHPYSQKHLYTCYAHPQQPIERLIENQDWDEISHWIHLWWIALGNEPITVQQYDY